MNADPETYATVGYQVATYLMQNKEYYIGHTPAIKIHGQTLPSEAREYVVNKKTDEAGAPRIEGQGLIRE